MRKAKRFLCGNRMKVCNNSSAKVIETSDSDGKPIIYSILYLYKFGKNHEMCEIESKNRQYRALITIDSTKKLINRGYIDNAVLTSNNTIRHHKNKIADLKCIPDFEEVNLKGTGPLYDEALDMLEKKFVYVINIDTDVKNISRQRLMPCGMIFDITGHPMAVITENEFEHKVIEINKFCEMATLQYNEGNFSPRSEARNSFRVLPYVRFEIEEYDRLLSKLGESALRNIKKLKSLNDYTLKVELITPKIAFEKFKGEVYYAIPNPEAFDDKNYFESSLRGAYELPKTVFEKGRYTVTKIDVSGIESVNILLNDYETLHTGKYHENYRSITQYLINRLGEKQREAEYQLERSLAEIAYKAEHGVDVTDIFNALHLMILDDTLEVTEDEANAICERIASRSIDKDFMDKYMRLATLNEALELFDIPPIEPNKYAKENMIKSSSFCVDTDVCIDIAYISDNGSIRVEIRREGDKVYARLINENTHDDIIIKDSVTTYDDFINNGIDKTLLVEPLKRITRSVRSSISIEDILKELRID